MEAPGDEEEPETEEQPEEEVETEETPDAEEGNTVDTTQNTPPENQQEEVYDDTVVGDADADEIADEEQTNPPNEDAERIRITIMWKQQMMKQPLLPKKQKKGRRKVKKGIRLILPIIPQPKKEILIMQK